MIGLIGSTLGVVSGVFGSICNSQVEEVQGRGFGGGGGRGAPPQITPIFVPGDIANVWVLLVVLSVIAGLYPAWKASGLSPVLCAEKITLVNRLERTNLIVELGKKTTRMKNRESYHEYCFSVLNGDDEDLMRPSLAREGGVE